MEIDNLKQQTACLSRADKVINFSEPSDGPAESTPK